MAFFDAVTPAALEAGRTLSLLAMIMLIGVGFIPPLRPYAHRILWAVTGLYVAGAVAIVAYAVLR